MRILMVNNYFEPNIVGGTEVSVKILSDGLTAKGHVVAVFSLDSETKQDVLERVNGILVYRSFFDYHNNIEKFFNGIFNRRIAAKLKKIIDDFKPEIIHTNNFESLSTIWTIAEKCNIPVVHTIRDYQYYPLPMLKNEKYDCNLLLKFIRRCAFAYRGGMFSHYLTKVTVVTAASKFILDKFNSIGYTSFEKSVVIPNCVDFNLSDVKKIIEKKYNRTNGIVRFLFVGRLEREKGLIELVSAFDRLPDNARLLICGEGSLRDYVKDKSYEDARIKYFGKLQKKELEKVYFKADVVVVPSIWEEPFGRIIIEGAKYGNAIIVSKRGGMPEIVNTLHCGEVFDFEDFGLEKAMRKMMDRDKTRMLIKGIADNLNIYSLNRQLLLFENLYKRVLKCK